MLTKPTLLGHFASVLLLCSSSMVAMAADETEPNNDKTTANEIAVGGSLNGKISSVSDTDWFKLTGIQTGNSYEIKAINVGRDVDVRLELSMPDGKLSSSNKGFEGDPETILFDATAGDYFVEVKQTGFFGTDTVYTLTLTDITKPKEAGSISLLPTDANTLTEVVAGTTPSNVEFQLFNSEGKTAGMGNKPVTFTLTGPAGWTSPSLSTSIKTDADGKFTFDWKDAGGTAISFSKAGEYTLKVTAEGKEKSVTLTVIPAAPHHLGLTCAASSGVPTEEVPTYIEKTLTFEVCDQYENLVKAGQTIDVQITPDSSSSLTTDDKGQVNVVFTPDQAVVYTIKALSPPTEVMTVNSSLPTLVGQVGEDKTSVTFTLTHKDKKGIEGQKIEVSLQQPDGAMASLAPSDALTNDVGMVTVSLKDATVAGNYVVSAKLSVPNSKIKDSTGTEQEKIEVTVSVSPKTPDSLTVKEDPNGTGISISSDDTASAQITFVLKAGEKPADGTLNLSLKKPDEKSTACLVEATEKDCTTPVTTLEVKDGEGNVWLKDAKLAGEYTITASLSNSSSTSPQPAIVKVTVTHGVPKQVVMGDNQPGTVPHIALKKSGDEVIKLTDQYGNAMENGEVKVEVSLNGNPLTPAIPNLTISNGTFKLPATTFTEVGKYTVTVTLDPNPPVKMEVEVGNLAVTEGGNQILVVSQSQFVSTAPNKSKAITLTLKDGAGVDEISKTSAGQEVKDKTVTLTLTDSLGNPVTAVTNLGLVIAGEAGGTPQNLLIVPKGEVKIIFQAPATVVSEAEPVAAYKITANVNGLEEYTEVFVVTKAVKELVGEGEGKIWPSLNQGEQLKRQATATECEGKGWAWNASGTPVKTEATFYGGLKKETDTGAFQVKIDGDGEVMPKTVDENGKFIDGTGDPVVVQGVIKVDDKDKVAELFVLGENEFPDKFGKDQKGNNFKGLYMLGRPLGDIRPLDGTKMLEELIAFRRSVTPDQDDYILLEMYRGAFYYPGTLKIFFGYYTETGTIVHNCTPIEVKISE